MADMITAPERHVVADGRERLNGVVLEDETVVADGELREQRAPGADVADELVPERSGRVVLAGPHRVHLRVTERDEHRETVRRIARRDVFEIHERPIQERRRVPIRTVDGERHDLVGRISRKIVVREAGNIPRAEHHDISHRSA